MTVGHPAHSGTRVDVNPASAVARNARVQGDVTVVRYAGGDLTFRELDDKAARLAGVLTEGGVGVGDRVAFLGLNSTSFLVTMLATFRIGAIYVPVNFRLAGPELQRVIDRSGAATIVCEEGHRGEVDGICDGTALKRFLLVDDDSTVPVTDGGVPDRWETWSALIAAAERVTGVLPRSFDDPAILMFTSGTTGLPKGVILTYGNAWWNSVNVDSVVDTRRGDVTHAVAPLFHVGALNTFVLRTLVRGGTIVLRRSFDPDGLLADLVDGVDTMFGVPSMFQALARVPGFATADLSRLRSVIVAAAPVPPSLIEQYAARGVFLQQAWGLTETAPFATHLPVERTLAKVGSAGVAMPYTEVRVIDAATNEPCPDGVAGEIVVRGPNVTPGYWENPEATAAAFDDAGWFHSGDMGPSCSIRG